MDISQVTLVAILLGGGASLAFKLGLTITEVKRRGDWSSEAVIDYIFLDDEQDRAIAARLVNGASVLVK